MHFQHSAKNLIIHLLIVAFCLSRIVKEMIKREPLCVNFRGKNEQTPLHRAAEKGNFELAQIILKARPDINAV